MKIIINRNDLFEPLQSVCGVVERRQTLPILANVLIQAENNTIRFTASDMEVEISYLIEHEIKSNIRTTVPARKFVDIIKSLPDDQQVEMQFDDENVTIKCGRSRFKLSTMPADEYPLKDQQDGLTRLEIPERQLKQLIDSTQFAMAHQDVRYYLNGLLFEIAQNTIRSVATDGHRLAISEITTQHNIDQLMQVIVPRKGVLEMSRLVAEADNTIDLEIGQNYIRLITHNQTLTSKLIDGKFPDYERVIPVDSNKKVIAERIKVKNGLARTSILSNEKFRGIRLQLEEGKIITSANNPEHESAEEEIDVIYSGDSMEIGFNVSYILDVMNVIKSDEIMIQLKDADSSCLITAPDEPGNRYVIMPMRL